MVPMKPVIGRHRFDNGRHRFCGMFSRAPNFFWKMNCKIFNANFVKKTF